MQAPSTNKNRDKLTRPEALEAADRLHSAAIHLLRRLRTRDRELGIGPAQLSALSVLVFGGPQSLASLAEAEQVKPPTMSRMVTALLRAKLIHRRTDKQDRRALIIEATEKGVRIMQEGRRRRVETLAAAVQALQPDEIKRLHEAAQLMEHLSRQA
ncbi:MAG TPA: MarR family transcriptional regulator [Terriglobales bacterium]|jgi:DNA-binding MarR family transcriptional regulator|nr:MarR family transcriptional regulator [Terriglobales bacterium]